MIKRLIIMAFLMQKRLLKKPSFIAVLLLIPLATASITSISKRETGLLKIAIYAGKNSDKTANEVITRIKEHKNTLNSVFYNDPNAAKNSVINNESDCAWIFPENLSKETFNYINNRNSDKKLVEIFIREETITTKLAGELLFGSVFPEVSKEIYLSFIKNELKLDKAISDSEMMNIYYKINTDKNIIKFIDEEGHKTDTTKILVLPMRGLLSIFIMLSALASAMYFTSDLSAGVFATMPRKQQLFLLYCSVFFGALDCGAASLISIAFTPLFSGFSTEISAMAIFIPSISAFSVFFAVLIGDFEKIGVFLCFISLSVLAFCPVLFSFNLPIVSNLLPQTYYLKLSGKNNLICETALLTGYFICSVIIFNLHGNIKIKRQKSTAGKA